MLPVITPMKSKYWHLALWDIQSDEVAVKVVSTLIIFMAKCQVITDNCRTVFNCQPLAESLSTMKKKRHE